MLFTEHRNYCVHLFLLHIFLWIITTRLLRKSVMLLKSESSGRGSGGSPPKNFEKKRVLNGAKSNAFLMNARDWSKFQKWRNFINWQTIGALSSTDFATLYEVAQPSLCLDPTLTTTALNHHPLSMIIEYFLNEMRPENGFKNLVQQKIKWNWMEEKWNNL